MAKRFLLLLGLLMTAWSIRVQAQEPSRLTFALGGGVSAPLNQNVGVSGNFITGAGITLNRNSSVEGDFTYSGLPPSLSVLHPISAPSGKMSLYSLGANYRYHIDSIRGSLFGAYIIGGGGWYYRHASVDKNYVVPPQTVCQPIYYWWGYGCDAGGYVYSATVAYKGTSAGGLNVGSGFTIRLADSPWKFYTEARYTYAWNSFIPTKLIPVTFGFRYN